jgi:hypothetical protein
MVNSKLRILVCYYKDIFLKPNHESYYLLQCGVDSTGIDLGIQKDNLNSNISSRNKYWSEITGLYWAWKNLPKTDYVGLCSYRRYFNFKYSSKPIEIITLESASKINSIEIPNLNTIFKSHDIIIPIPYTFAYNFKKICEMNYRIEDFKVLQNCIHELFPDYDDAYFKIFNQTNKFIGHNMFIMKWDDYNEYCNWVFIILFEVEKKIDPTEYSITQIRVFGYMHEILLSVFIENKKMKPYYSQLTWITSKSENFKFNNFFYRFLAIIYYNLKKSLVR